LGKTGALWHRVLFKNTILPISLFHEGRCFGATASLEAQPFYKPVAMLNYKASLVDTVTLHR